eukprot:11196635-Lingulodinium_polyedra.AAC.1
MSPVATVYATTTTVAVAPFGSLTPSKITRQTDGGIKFGGVPQNRDRIEAMGPRAKMPLKTLIALRE